MQVVLPDLETRATFTLDCDRPMNDDEYFDFCMLNPDLRIERKSSGEIIIMPPAGGETGYRNSDLITQLTTWARKNGRGRAFDSNTEYILPNGAALAPDASWVLKSRLDLLTKEEKKKFLPFCPDFVVELMSPTDRLKNAKAKMQEWIDNGAQLGWLLDPDRRAVYIYRPKQDPEHLSGVESLRGEPPVDGFELALGDIWAGL